MKRLVLLLAFTACGDSTVTVTGEVEVVHKIDLGSFEDQYRKYCEELYDTEREVEDCVDEKMALLIEAFANAGIL